MTALVFAFGIASDVRPCAGLAIALRRRGHRVLLISSPVFEPLVWLAGLDFLSLGTDGACDHAVLSPDIWHPQRSAWAVTGPLILSLMREVYEVIARFSESGDTIAIAPATALGARIANERLGVRLATVHLQPVLLRSSHQPPLLVPGVLGRVPRALRNLYLRGLDRFIIDRSLAADVNGFRAQLGLPPVGRLFAGWGHSPQLTIGLFPEWFAPPQPDWPPHVHLTGFPLYEESVPWPLEAGLAGFLGAGEAPIVFTAGSASVRAEEFFRASVEICRASGRRGLLVTQFPEQLPVRLPAGVRHFDNVPFRQVLPRAAAFVHDGGIGTVAQAFASGVPQLVVPMAHDQRDHAARVRQLRVGEALLPKDYNANTALERLHRLLGSSSIEENCRRRAGDLAGNDALGRTCALIERLGQSHRRRQS